MKKRMRLFEARQKAGLTQSQLGEMTGMTKQAISNLEVGYSGTSVENWDRLEDALKVPQRQLRELVEV